MTVYVKEDKKMAEYAKNEPSTLPSSYGCEIISEKTTIENAKNLSYPNDAYLIWYKVSNETYIDLVRGKRSNIFDMYYDRYGSGSVQRIDFGYGRMNPKLWGISKKDNSKKKRK